MAGEASLPVSSGTSESKLRVLLGRWLPSSVEVGSSVSLLASVVVVAEAVALVEVVARAQKELTCWRAPEARGSLGQLL